MVENFHIYKFFPSALSSSTMINFTSRARHYDQGTSDKLTPASHNITSTLPCQRQNASPSSITFTVTSKSHFCDPFVTPFFSVYGPVEGFIHTTDSGVQARVFLGVPYAKPPIGALRFERPEPPTPWTKPLQTKTFKKPCIPITTTWLHGNSLDAFSEDCLYLNIIAPVNGTNQSVLVYIHGGNFCFGDVVRAGFDKYVKNFVSRGVIVVTVAYRLGVYGYFSTGDSQGEGNNGLWDQLAACKFIHENISNFGGNPNNVTLWGQSAGSAAVGILAVAPISRNYVNKVVQASGASAYHWGINDASVHSTKKLAKALGCESEKSSDIKKFLKKQKPEDIIEVSSTQFVSDFTADRFDKKYLCFGIRIDHNFLGGKRIEELIATAPPKPTIFGLMSNESGPFLSMTLTPDQIQNYSKTDVINGINKVISEKAAEDETDAIRSDLASFYLDNSAPQEPLSKFYFNQHGQFTNDYNFNASVLAEMEQKANSNWPLYFYVWNHLNSDVAKMLDCKGAFHSYELWFTSDEKVYPFDQHGAEEKQIAELYCEVLCNFARTGNPSTSNIVIPKFANDKKEALWIDLKPSIRSKVFAGVHEFYQGLENKYKYSVRSGIKKA